MSEEQNQEPTPDESQPAREETTDWKAEARKWEQRAKDNKGAADRLAEVEKSNAELTAKLTDFDALAEKVSTFEAEKERAQIVSEVAKAKDVPADLLRGSTREDLEAHADLLNTHLSKAGPVVPGQEQQPVKVPDNEQARMVRSLFGTN